jgi:hypothetical protein
MSTREPGGKPRGVNLDARFREDDNQNAVEQDGRVRIRGQIHPINVLEPILWRGQSVAA